MSLLVQIAWQGDLATFARDTHLKFARGARTAADRMLVQAKLAYRAPVRQAFGDRLANTVRGKIYPESASVHTHSPTILIYSKAPKILFAFATGVTIHGVNGVWLAIPTRDVPRKRQGRPLSVEETKERFGKNLVLIPGSGGRGLGSAHSGVMLLVLKELKIRRKTGRWRNASQREIGRGASHDVVMFILVRQVTLQKRLDWSGITEALGSVWVDLFSTELARALGS